MQLRDYQQAAVDAVYGYLREHDGNPCIVLPVGSGKSWVIAQMATDTVSRWGGRALIVTHSAELVEQDADKILRLCPDLDLGIYCAGMRQRATSSAVICASIQSIYRRACELGPFDLVIVDEAHCIPVEGEGMYRTFLKEARVVNPRLRLIGATATPFRTSSGALCGPDRLLNDVCCDVGLRELIVAGYLSPLVSKNSLVRVDVGGLHVRAGEFVSSEVEQLMDQDALVEAACAEIVQHTQDRQACLIFSAGVQHGRHVARVLAEKHGVECGFVSAETPRAERDELLARFRGEARPGLFTGEPLKYLSNCAILTTGVDVPRLDAIAILRPTMSPGLLVQMIGRGTRLHPGKANCLVLDFGGNLLRHVPVDQIRIREVASNGSGQAPAKECPECHSVIAAGYTVCPDCGHVFPAREKANHEPTASTEGVLSGQVMDTTYTVRDVFYSVHTKRGADEDAPKTMRVTYQVGWHQYQNEWVCLEHQGYARWRGEQWWRARSHDPVPNTVQQAVDIANNGGLARTLAITVRSVAGEKYERIIDYELGEKPEPAVYEPASQYDPADIPF